MTVLFKMTNRLLNAVRTKLETPHPFASERVGFLTCRPAVLGESGVVILSHGLHDVADEDYIDDPSVGAMMGPDAIRKALQLAYNEQASMFHVHLHSHKGKPRFSQIDEKESAKFVPDFWNVQPDLPHGAIVFSDDSAYGKCWIPGQRSPEEISEFAFIGVPMRKI